MCREIGRTTAATVVDHVIPFMRAGVIDHSLRLDPNNLQSLCKPCHDAPKQRQDKTGRVQGCDVNGDPIAGWMA
jgi:5-methylcytosine-specific restriction protein A